MLTLTDICNVALGYLNHPALATIDDTNRPEAELCRRLLPAVTDRLFGEHCWTFATRAVRLARLSGQSPYEDYPNIFPLPGDCVRIVCLDDGTPYIREAGKLYCAADDPLVKYVKRVDCISDWPARFTAAVCYLLAAELAMPLSNDLNIHAMLYRRYQDESKAAMCDDSIENFETFQNRPLAGSWTTAHKGGY